MIGILSVHSRYARSMKRIIAVLAAAAWVIANEFVRNQLVLLEEWEAHYAGLGMGFPAAPINGAVWAIWSLLLAVVIHLLSRRFALWETTGLAWTAGFALMWLVIGNLGVLPYGILAIAIPWSMGEVLGAAWIIMRLAGGGVLPRG